MSAGSRVASPKARCTSATKARCVSAAARRPAAAVGARRDNRLPHVEQRPRDSSPAVGPAFRARSGSTIGSALIRATRSAIRTAVLRAPVGAAFRTIAVGAAFVAVAVRAARRSFRRRRGSTRLHRREFLPATVIRAALTASLRVHRVAGPRHRTPIRTAACLRSRAPTISG
jgi:hypothetical protein